MTRFGLVRGYVWTGAVLSDATPDVAAVAGLIAEWIA